MYDDFFVDLESGGELLVFWCGCPQTPLNCLLRCPWTEDQDLVVRRCATPCSVRNLKPVQYVVHERGDNFNLGCPITYDIVLNPPAGSTQLLGHETQRNLFRRQKRWTALLRQNFAHVQMSSSRQYYTSPKVLGNHRKQIG